MNPLLPLTAVAAGAALLLASKPVAASIDYDYGDEGGGPLEYGMNSDDNIAAMLAVLRLGESDDDYAALYGGGQFNSFSNHPTINQGFEGTIVHGKPTHAAGAYQFQPGTWPEAKNALGLPDFSPESQDSAALFLIRRRNALDAVKKGDIPGAMHLLRNEWTSLAHRGESWVRSTFIANGGKTA